MTILSSAILQIKEKYGPEAASDIERIINTAVKDEVLPDLIQLQDSLTSIIGAFSPGDMVPATDLQKKSFKELQKTIRERKKLMLLYKSAPSAIMLDLKTLMEIEEKVSSMIAALHWKTNEGRDVSPDEFWQAIEEARPRA